MITKAEIRELLMKRQDAVERAVVVLYQMQTPDERGAHITVEKNGVGFNAFDAGILTSFAEQIIENKWNRNPKAVLTEKQLVIARKKVLRYVGQLTAIAEARHA